MAVFRPVDDDSPEPPFPPPGTDPDLVPLGMVAEMLGCGEARALDCADFARDFPKRRLISVAVNRHRPVWSRAAVTEWASAAREGGLLVGAMTYRRRSAPTRPASARVATLRTPLLSSEQAAPLLGNRRRL